MLFNKKKSFVASLLDGLARTVSDGDEAIERALAGTPIAGDEKRIANALAIADMMKNQHGREAAPV